MTQLALPFAAERLARRTDAQTSKQSAAATVSFRARHIALIWGTLKEYGPMTAKQIAACTALDNVQVSRRGKEMEARRLVTIGPDTRDGCRIWRAV